MDLVYIVKANEKISKLIIAPTTHSNIGRFFCCSQKEENINVFDFYNLSESIGWVGAIRI